MEGINIMVVSEPLSEDNYEEWCIQVKTYLEGRDLWDVVEADEPAHENETQAKAWRQKNKLALHAIQTSCEMGESFCVIKRISSAKAAWAALADEYGEAESEPESESESDYSSCRSSISSAVGSDQNPTETNDDDDFQQYESFLKAVSRGDWDTALVFLDKHPDAVKVRDPNNSGKNALHVAVAKGHLNVVEKLVERMTDEDVEMTINYGLTVLAAAIEIENMPIVKCLIRRNRNLLSIPHWIYGLPVQQAVLSGQSKMARYLYCATRVEDLDQRSASDFLTHCISETQLDIALHLTECLPHLAITMSHLRSPVFVLSRAKVFPRPCSLNFWQRWIYDCIRVPDIGTDHVYLDIQYPEENSSDGKELTFFIRYTKIVLSPMRRLGSCLQQLFGIKNVYEIKLVHVQIMELLNRMCEVIKATSDEKSLKRAGVREAILEAAEIGNIEFITGILKAKPQFFDLDISRQLLDIAINFRLAKIFRVVLGLPSQQTIQFDQLMNVSLEKAAIIAPSRVLNRTPGAALQLQRELQWFKEVDRIASHCEWVWTIENIQRARDKFSESHKDLVIAGEKWMKETSSSCTVVGALIITVTFTAAFTFPGGNDENSGFPMFVNMMLFRVFTLFNAIALISSTTSVLTFLGILTSRYAQEDFVISLPTKLVIGLSTLLLSIAAMIIAFCVGLSIMFHQQLWIVIPSASLAIIPVALFVRMQYPLLRDIFMSTMPSIILKWVEGHMSTMPSIIYVTFPLLRDMIMSTYGPSIY